MSEEYTTSDKLNSLATSASLDTKNEVLQTELAVEQEKTIISNDAYAVIDFIQRLINQIRKSK